MGLRVGTITILFLLRKRVHVHSELQADINYIVPTSFSVVFPALDLVPHKSPSYVILGRNSRTTRFVL